MANVIISPNMGLTIPVAGVDPGPDYANNINNSFSVLDAHTHAPGSGVQINPNGININADLTFNTNNATDLLSVRFTPQITPLVGALDLGCLYEAGVDLYYNDGSGNVIRMTQGGSVSGSAGTITGLPSGSASAAYASSNGTFVFQQATSTGANLDVASIAIRYPGSYPTPAGNYIQIQAPASLATGYAITLPNNVPVTSGALLTESTAGIVSYTNVDNSTLEISSNLIQVKANGVTTIAKNAKSLGLNVVVSNTNATNSLAIIRGTIEGSAGGGGSAIILAGEGFSVVRNSSLNYTVTFTTPFADAAVVTVSQANGSNISLSSQSADYSVGFTITSGGAEPHDISFIAIGQRA